MDRGKEILRNCLAMSIQIINEHKIPMAKRTYVSIKCQERL